MKKTLNFLIFLLIMLFISSCDKDESLTPESVSSEKWFFDKVVYQEYNKAGDLLNSATEANWTANDYLSLISDGKFEMVQHTRKITGDFELDKDFLTLSYFYTNTESMRVPKVIKGILVDKTPSVFVFHIDEPDANGKFRSTIYLKN